MSGPTAFIEECAGLFDLGSVQGAKQFRRVDSIDPSLSFRVGTSSGEWFVEAFDDTCVRAEDVRFMAGYAAELATRDLTPALRRTPDGNQIVQARSGGRTYHIVCRPWIRGQACEPEGWTKEYLTQVGQFLADMHAATRRWRPGLSRVAWDFSVSASQAVERAAAWGCMAPDDLAYLACVVVRAAGAVSSLGIGQQVPIHGDPWHGNLLLSDGRLQAIDLGTCGLGPRVGDIAVWFYWAVLSFGASAWREPFNVVLSAYESRAVLADSEKAVILSLACLRHLWFLIEEVEGGMAVAPGDREAIDFYIRDHASAIRTIEGIALSRC